MNTIQLAPFIVNRPKKYQVKCTHNNPHSGAPFDLTEELIAETYEGCRRRYLRK